METNSSDSDHSNLDLLRTGKYSDLNLLCEGQTIRVHRAIVCPKSDVLATICDSLFRESVEKEIRIEIASVPTLRRVLDYIYGGKYLVSMDKTLDYPSEEIVILDPSKYVERISMAPNAALLCHLNVIKMADYYQIRGLVTYAHTQLTEAVHSFQWLQLDKGRFSFWLFDGAIDVIRTCFVDAPSCLQKSTKEILLHILELHKITKEQEDFMAKAMEIPDFAIALWRVTHEVRLQHRDHMYQRLAALEGERSKLKRVLRRHDIGFKD